MFFILLSRKTSLVLMLSLIITSIARSQTTVQYPDAYLRAKVTAGKSYSPEQVRRIGDLGKLWGMLHYFNPRLHTEKVITDSLVIRASAIVSNDPSADGFRQAVKLMLAALNDGGTTIQEAGEMSPAQLFNRGSALPVVHQLANDNLYIAFPTLAANMLSDPSEVKGLSPQEWTSAKGIIIDIRNASRVPEFNEYNFIFDVMPMIRQVIAGSKP
ncbi:MAG: hypothetical protein EOO00_11775, partial [Chitinophagaceae bacterium]